MTDCIYRIDYNNHRINFDNLPCPPTIYSMARAWVFNNPTTV